MSDEHVSSKTKSEAEETPSLKCGIIMPISTIDGCTESHWEDVLSIICEAAESAGFTPSLVSAADETNVIQKTIVHNLYNNDIVVCDVSCKNPNVMFELGMRLAFDKPAIIIKDDKTDYSFDTSIIEHLIYRRDLRHNTIVLFKKKLCEKIINTHRSSTNSVENFSFLRHFGQFTASKIDTQEVSDSKFIIQTIKELEDKVERMSEGSHRVMQLVNQLTYQSNNRAISPGELNSPTISLSFPRAIRGASILDTLKACLSELRTVKNNSTYVNTAEFTERIKQKGISIDNPVVKEFIERNTVPF